MSTVPNSDFWNRRQSKKGSARDPDLGRRDNNAGVAQRSVTASKLTRAVSSEVVGRAVEFAALREALDAATRGNGSLLFLVGEAGIGKSRLIEVIASDAVRHGLPVLRGRAVQSPTPAAYRPLTEALSSAVRAGASPDVAELGPFGATLGRLVPEWRIDEHAGPDESLLAVAEGVLRFLAATAGDHGALLVLEDLHWADPETLTIVEYLADNLAEQRVLCLVSVRDDERSPGLALGWSLHARRVSRLLPIAPLDEQEVAAMVASCLGAATVPDEVVAFAARADGVPFVVEELLAAALASGALAVEEGRWRVSNSVDAVVPLTFSESMRRRVARLGAHGRAVLVAAAVLGRRFDWSLLPAVTGLGQEAVLAALHEAVDAQIVLFDRGNRGFGFRHALSRDAVLAELFPPELEALSRRALEAVEAAHPVLEDEWCGLAAELTLGAGDRIRAATLLVVMARRAFQRGALATAEAILDRAHGLLPGDNPTSLDVEEFLLQVLSLAGKRERAVEVATSLLARLGGDPRSARRRAEVHLRLARAAVAATRWEEAHELLEQARVETAAAHDDDLEARLDAVRAQTAMGREPEQAPALARAALEAAERLALADVACEALEVLGRSQRPHDLAAAETTFARALALAEANGLTLWRARALHELGAIDMLRGRGVERLEEARELALGQGALATAAVVDVQMAAALVIGEDPEAGAVAAQRSAELARRYRLDQTLAAAAALEAYVHARSRRRREMQRCIDEALAVGLGVPDIEVKTSTAAALLGLVEEDRATARRDLCAGLRAASHGGRDYSAVPAIGLLALLRQLDGAEDETSEIEIPEESVHFLASAFLRYADAVAAGRSGDADLAAACMAEGDNTLGGHRWFRYLGWRLVAEAAVFDGWGDPVPWLREALDFFDRRGDDHIASACRSILRKAGAAVPRRRGETGVPVELRALGVTSRELEVLRLLARGLQNREIAGRLYLSPRTVERHVANLAGKTGATRRAQLVAYAARAVGGDARSS
ncbi:ATP-binding protein [Geodermatophilus chilensis]|uniref:ATP-binding protein n=1 Tax=Geodermatophilus chilensis TaxID=2035835 RepID=UPI000C25DC98|nr:LuxR family transcriptional regulator [Geodermatophilus chilensis]